MRNTRTELLALDPEHPEALHLLGAVRFQQGRLGDAEPLMRRSIEHRPVPLALANYAAVLTGAGGSTTRSRVSTKHSRSTRFISACCFSARACSGSSPGTKTRVWSTIGCSS